MNFQSEFYTNTMGLRVEYHYHTGSIGAGFVEHIPGIINEFARARPTAIVWDQYHKQIKEGKS